MTGDGSWESVDTWQDSYRVHSYEVDSKGRAALSALGNYMQESAWRHAERLGLGFSQLSRKNLSWVLSRQRMVIDAFPKWGDTIKVMTWPTGHDRLFCYRDFKLLDAADGVIGKATTAWFAIDMASRRPQRADTYFHLRIPAGVEQVFSDKLGKLPAPDATDFTGRVRVGYRDLDVNGHVNNTRYMDWLLAGLALDFLKAHTLKELEINYLSEALYDDEISIRREERRDLLFSHSLTRGQDHMEICRAATGWRADD